MKKQRIWGLLLACTCLAHGEEFSVRDVNTGQTFGPYELRDGVRFAVGERTLELTLSSTSKREITRKRMQQIIIPEIEFRQANLRDVVRYLREVSLANDPEGVGINIVLSLQEPDRDGRARPAQGDPWGGFGRPSPPVPQGDFGKTITLNLRRVSLYDALKFVSDVAGMAFVIDESGTVLLTDKPGSGDTQSEEDPPREAP